ncbi:unnamed protein product [Rotaria magnacalcarata]
MSHKLELSFLCHFNLQCTTYMHGLELEFLRDKFQLNIDPCIDFVLNYSGVKYFDISLGSEYLMTYIVYLVSPNAKTIHIDHI